MNTRRPDNEDEVGLLALLLVQSTVTTDIGISD